MHHNECVEGCSTKTKAVLNAVANISTHPVSVPNSLPSPSTNGVFPFSSLPFFSLSSSFSFSISMSMSFFSSSPPPPPPPPQTTATAATYLTNLGFGYSIAIALGFLFLLSTIILSSYLCCRTLRSSNNNNHHIRNHNNEGVVLPRVIFVAEDDLDAGQNDNIVLGLDQSVINSYPKFQHNKDNNVFGGNYDGVCSICLCEYKDSEILRMMPECRHCFHACCLDAWLKLNGSCPVCRNSPMPTPLSTPLQEVVPLAHYAADHRRSRN